jgi:hypothetical protein
MKSRYIVALFAVCCLSGCASLNPSSESKAKPFDREAASTETITYKDPPPDKAVTLSVTNGITISEIDGSPVYWQAPDKGFLNVVLPAGKHKIIARGASGEKEFDMLFFEFYVYDLAVGDDSLLVINRINKPVADNSTDSKTVARSKKSSGSSSGSVWVKGHYRKNGSYVKGHYRRKK